MHQRRGVATYWVADPDARLVEVWHPADERPEIVTDVLRWRVADEPGELEIELGESVGISAFRRTAIRL